MAGPQWTPHFHGAESGGPPASVPASIPSWRAQPRPRRCGEGRGKPPTLLWFSAPSPARLAWRGRGAAGTVERASDFEKASFNRGGKGRGKKQAGFEEWRLPSPVSSPYGGGRRRCLQHTRHLGWGLGDHPDAASPWQFCFTSDRSCLGCPSPGTLPHSFQGFPKVVSLDPLILYVKVRMRCTCRRQIQTREQASLVKRMSLSCRPHFLFQMQ